MVKKTKEQIEDEDWEERFYTNWQLEDGTLVPSRACQYVVWGIKDIVPKAEDKILYFLMGSSLNEGLYKELAKAIKSGDTTEIKLMKQLRERGREIGREISGEKEDGSTD